MLDLLKYNIGMVTSTFPCCVIYTFRDCLRRKPGVPKERAATATLHILTSKASKDRLNLMQQEQKTLVHTIGVLYIEY